MPAVACVLDKAVARCGHGHAVTKQSAQIADLLRKLSFGGVGVGVCTEQERVAALHAHIFVTAVSIDQAFVRVMAEETGQRVTNARDAAVFGKVGDAAAAMPRAG